LALLKWGALLKRGAQREWGRRLVRLGAGLGLALALSACAASYQPMGPIVSEPRLTGAALVAGDGFELPMRIWQPAEGPARGVIVALHGFNDYSNAFDGAGKYLAENGIAVYAYDQRGFGRTRERGIWPGADTLVSDLKAAVQVVRGNHPGVPVYLMGESMGGAVVLATLTDRDAPRVDGAILVAPAVWGRETMGFFPRTALWLAYNLVPGMTMTAPRELKIQPSDNIEMLRALGRDPLVIKGTRVDAINGLTDLMDRALASCGKLKVPSLVLYGANEQVLPPRPVMRAIRTFEDSGRHVVAVYPKGYHMLLRDLEGETVLADIASWIHNPGIPLASGADRGPRALVAAR